jgi:hypothetical protein
MGIVGTRTGRAGQLVFGVGFLLALAPVQASAQWFNFGTPRPPAEVPAPAAPNNAVPAPPPAERTAPPKGSKLETPAAPPAAAAAHAHSPPATPPAGAVSLAVSARFGRDLPAISGGLNWRIYKAEQNGGTRLVKEDRGPAPTFALPPGTYVINAGFGLANVTKAVQLRGEAVREVFDLAAGGLRIEGRVGDARIPPGQISFELYKGSQFEPGDKRPIAQSVATGDILLVPEGTYHIVSNYGDANSTVRSDIRVQVGKLTDTTVNHRAAIITLKLVTERGGEARANTQWSVLTPGGDVIKESMGAFPRVILAEGDYRVIARNDGKPYQAEFKVVTGVDREVEVLAR